MFDTVMTDPPYGVDYVSRVDKSKQKGWGSIAGDGLRDTELSNFLSEAIPEAKYRFVWCSWEGYPAFVDGLGVPRSVCIWVKECFGLGKGYRRQFEMVLFYGSLNRTDLSDVWQFSREQAYQHPTQKPVKMITKALRDVDAELIYDPFLGSGTTMVAAEQLGRVCYGMEIEPKYVAVALERMADMGLDPVLANG